QGSSQGAGDAFLNRLQSQTHFIVSDGNMTGIWLLDILARQTLIDTFASLSFFNFSGGLDIADGMAKLHEMRVEGDQHRISIDGEVGLADGAYRLSLTPAIATGIVDRVGRNQWIPS